MIEAIVVGVSAGGFSALETIAPALRRDLPVPVFLVQHSAEDETEYVCRNLGEQAEVSVKEAGQGAPVARMGLPRPRGLPSDD